MIKQLLPLALLIFIVSCKKSDTPVQSSDKSISSVVFKVSDNPGLSADITGTASQDTIKFILPSNIPVSHLVPTINFIGKSIDPANRTAQDFTSGIRYKITAEDGSISNYLFKVEQTQADTSTL
ncbi:MAG TPA: hypothetical protein VMY77_15500, partial [Chitinophagaceae bacterium]|nr:hypothetical protein [Chitinophagaceae bacterium]